MITNAPSTIGTASTVSGKNNATIAAVLIVPWIATQASSSPSRLEPASPMKIEAGWKLWYRNPNAAPAVIAARTPALVQVDAPSRHALSRDNAMIARVPAAIVQTPAASPSTPSVKLTTFITATIPRIVTGPLAPARPRWQRNGSVNVSTRTPASTGINAAPICPSNLTGAGR